MENVSSTGKIKFLNGEKGYGFIIDNDGKNEYFYHVSGLIDTVVKDDNVSYTLENGNRGIKAVNITLIK